MRLPVGDVGAGGVYARRGKARGKLTGEDAVSLERAGEVPVVIRAEEVLLYLLRRLGEALAQVEGVDPGGAEHGEELIAVLVAVVALPGDEQRVLRVHLRGAEHVKKLRALTLGERGKLRNRVRRGAHVLLFRVEVCEHAVGEAHYLVAYAAPRQLAVQPVQVDKGVLAHGVGNESVVHLSGEALEIRLAGDEV